MDKLLLQCSPFILICPFLAFLVNGLYLGKRSWKAAAWLAVFLNGASLVIVFGLCHFFVTSVIGQHELYPEGGLTVWQWPWLSFASQGSYGFDLLASIGIYLDSISMMMLLVITFISVLVNIYSIGYMKKDPSAGRFFSLLSLFSFSMLGLVVATNIIQLYVFWELVGFSSYALIGFWYHKPSAVAASKKAFIITRFADAFFLLGIVLLAYFSKTFDFFLLNHQETARELNQSVSLGFFSVNLLSLSCLLIYCGAWGKSAMFPLHVWLPDAMEGPTPVSSIIHSATMVVAGVYLSARMFPLFAASEGTLELIKTVGVFTALFAAVIACTQFDIKRILAFSTLSQIGYMMFSLGTAKTVSHGISSLGFSASMFHIFTHAFFKCLLFLSAGAIIHAVHSNDIWKMGGLRKYMPWTYISTLIACLAIAGVFPFSGFFSKDEILLSAYLGGHQTTFWVGLIASGLTAFYMFRYFFLIFHGKARHAIGGSFHEDLYMTFSIVVLAIPSAIAGFWAQSFFLHHVKPPISFESEGLHHLSWLPWVAVSVGVLGILFAFFLYGTGQLERVRWLRSKMGRLGDLVENKFYIDEFYLFVTHKIIFRCVAEPAKWFDRHIVDGTMNLIGALCKSGGTIVRFVQNGHVQFYLGVFLLGLFLFHFVVKI